MELKRLFGAFDARRSLDEKMPWPAALACDSFFDIALHDAYGNIGHIPTYQTHNRDHMNANLGKCLKPANGSRESFHRFCPQDFFATPVPARLPAWRLVGGRDLMDESERTGTEPQDGYPVFLRIKEIRCELPASAL